MIIVVWSGNFKTNNLANPLLQLSDSTLQHGETRSARERGAAVGKFAGLVAAQGSLLAEYDSSWLERARLWPPDSP